MRIHLRYDTQDENKSTRRERNDSHGIDSPEFIVPTEGLCLWSWYRQISDSVNRIVEGVCRPIPPSEFLAWQTLSRNIVNSIEYAILTAMDRVFCEETNIELQNLNIRQREAHEKEIESRSRKK